MAPETILWVSTNGLTKCASSEALQINKSLLCVLLHILPREIGRVYFNVDPRLQLL